MIITGLIVGGLYGGLLGVNISSENTQIALVVFEIAFLLIVVTNILMGISSTDSIKRNHACIIKTTSYTFAVAILLVVVNFVTTFATDTTDPINSNVAMMPLTIVSIFFSIVHICSTLMFSRVVALQRIAEAR